MFNLFSYDSKQNILYMQAIEPVIFNSEEQLDSFYNEILHQLQSLTRKPYMVADITGYTVSPKIATAHGNWMKNQILPGLLGMVRYGKPTLLNEISIRTQAVQRDYEVFIHSDLSSALIAINKMKQKASKS